jgi:phosphatidylserine decarboxylase
MSIEKLKWNVQYVLPHHPLSRFIARLANCKIRFVKNFLIKLFIYCYKVDLSSAQSTDLNTYPSFNHFFTRPLNPAARPIIMDEMAIASPADGMVSQAGRIDDSNLFQIKGHLFRLMPLLGGHYNLAKTYEKGQFVIIYLAPPDYHRVHMPLDGKLMQTIYVPGKLFSVSTGSVQHIPDLFSRNERLISLFETEIGEVALIMVGAMLVAGIETVWGKRETPCHSRNLIVKDYQDKGIFLKRGEEMGRFQFGSTVILLFPPDSVARLDFRPDTQINMGALNERVETETLAGF